MALIDTFVFIRGSYGIPVELLDAGDVRILEHQGLIQITFGGAAVLSSAGGFRLYDINEGRVGIEYCPAVGARIGLLETLQILRNSPFMEVTTLNADELLELILLGLIRVGKDGLACRTMEGQKVTDNPELLHAMLEGRGPRRKPYVE